MTMQRLLPHDMLMEIDRVLLCQQDKSLQVYAEAEKIRRRFLQLNFALEDIVNCLVERSVRNNVAIAFNPAEARSAIMGPSACGQTETSEPLQMLQ